MTAPMKFTRAVRTAVKAKVLVTGPSGSGKTLGALRFAESLIPGARIAVLDSENDRASYYADAVTFDVVSLPDSEPGTYIKGLRMAVQAGYDIVIVDSLSHAWNDILDRKDEYDRKQTKPNSYMSWKLFGTEWEAFIREILDTPVHVIATARSKQAYEQTDDGGKKKVTKLGMAPQIREGTEYEFAFHFDLNAAHAVDVKKDNSRQLGDETRTWDLCDGGLATVIRNWMGTAKPVERPTPETCAAIDEAISRLPEAKQTEARRRWAVRRDKGVSETEAREMLAKMAAKAEPTPGSVDETAEQYANTKQALTAAADALLP